MEENTLLNISVFDFNESRGGFLNKILLHIEGLAVLFISVYFYAQSEFSWLLFIILLFTPDFAMLGYVFDKQVGAIVYNIFHSYTLPIGVVFLGVLLSNQTMLAVGLIWGAHIGMDRMVGYGLKYPTNFKDTHFQRV